MGAKASYRWGLALVATLLTPWIGPHADSYIPLCAVLVRAAGESPEAAFWLLAGGMLAVIYAAWAGALSALAWGWNKMKKSAEWPRS